MNADNLTKPRGDPQLIGLSSYKYSSSVLVFGQQQDCSSSDFGAESLIEKTMSHFHEKTPLEVQSASKIQFPTHSKVHIKNDAKEKGNSLTRATANFLKEVKADPSKFKKFSFTITLPHATLIEQMQFKLTDIKSLLTDPEADPKKKKEKFLFHKHFKILKIERLEQDQHKVMFVKNAFSERVTGKSLIEVNTCGVTQDIRITLVCLKNEILELFQQNVMNKVNLMDVDKFTDNLEGLDELDDEVALISQYHQTQDDQVDHRDVKIHLTEDSEEIQSAIERGIINDDEDDMRILDSLPKSYKTPQVTVVAKAEPLQSQHAENPISKLLESITIVGFNLNAIPAITNLTYFMNQSLLLTKHQPDQASKVDFLVGVLLITTKRAIQAAEVLRKLQYKDIKILENNLKDIERNQQSKVKECHQLFIQCAISELLIADSFLAESQLNEKIQALSRMTQFSKGLIPEPIRFQPQILQAEDVFSAILVILPDLLKFAILCLAHKKEIVKISALKILKFVFETQGCSLDFSMVLILKSILNTYPKNSTNALNSDIESDSDFDMQLLLGSKQDVCSFLFKHGQKVLQPNASQIISKRQSKTFCQQIIEPASGFKQAISSIYTHVLDSFISVLSSVSSHILHSIFYDVITDCLTKQNEHEVRVYACKIAEKIITICQGDLLISHQLMNFLIEVYCGHKLSLESIQSNQTMKNLWQSIRQKVFPNYSTKGYRQLIDWVSIKLNQLVYVKTEKPDVIPINQRNLPDDLSDENTLVLTQLCDIVSIIAISRQKAEDEANQLIKLPPAESFGSGTSSELVILLPQLIFWLEFTLDREDRLLQFQQIYQTIKDVLESLPANKIQLTMVQVLMPSLERIRSFLEGNSPSLPMLKFLDIALGDIQLFYFTKSGKDQRQQLSQIVPIDMQMFFSDLLLNFVSYMSYSLYEEVFLVFDKLLVLTNDVISEKLLKKCIVALVDKYTLKNKSHKNSLSSFMKSLLDIKIKRQEKPQKNSKNFSSDFEDIMDGELSMNHKSNYFELMCDFCFFENVEMTFNLKRNQNNGDRLEQVDFRGPFDLHEINVDKLQFFIDSLSLLNDYHINLFTNLITHPNFKALLLQLLEHSETSVRLKSHEILESLTSYFAQYCPSKTVYEFAGDTSLAKAQNELMDAEFISHERLYISQIVIQIAKKSLEFTNDCYLQFNALILLDFLFQNLLPVPNFHNEQIKAKKQNKEAVISQNCELEQTMDIEMFSISESTPELDVMDPVYLRMRMKLVLSLWPHIQNALISPWSNIRSICYGLVCSMLKVNISDYPNDLPEKPLKGVTGQRNSPISPEFSAEKAKKLNNFSDDLNNSGNPLSEIMSVSFQVTFNRLREIILPMLHSLLSSKESESKAGGLNILGSFCGLSYDFTGVKINKYLSFLQRNSKFISLPIWRLVYALQDDWDITIKEASVVLVQLCAPRNAINYFKSLKDKQKKLKLDYMTQNLRSPAIIYQASKPDESQGSSSLDHRLEGFKSRENNDQNPLSIKNYLVRKNRQAAAALNLFAVDKDKEVILERSETDLHQHANFNELEDFLRGKKAFAQQTEMNLSQIDSEHNVLEQQIELFNPGFTDSRLSTAPMTRKRQLELEFEMKKPKDQKTSATGFFVDQYTDEQIQEIISIFRNDFKPPKNLWIEKQPSPQTLGSGHGGPIGSVVQPIQNQGPDYYAEIYSEAIEQFNAHQAQMQQLQQAQLQQQVSSGSSMSSGSSCSELSIASDIDDKSQPDEKEKKDGKDEKDKSQQQNDQQNKDQVKALKEQPVETKPNKEREQVDRKLNEHKKPAKSGSLGLLDANGFKFLDGSDSDSVEPKQIVTEAFAGQQSRNIIMEIEKINFDHITIDHQETEVKVEPVLPVLPVETTNTIQPSQPDKGKKRQDNKGIQKWILRQMMQKPDKFINQIKGLKDVINACQMDQQKLNLVIDELFTVSQSPKEDVPTRQDDTNNQKSLNDVPGASKGSRLGQRSSRLAQVSVIDELIKEETPFLPIPSKIPVEQQPIFEKYPETTRQDQAQVQKDKDNQTGVRDPKKQQKRRSSKSFSTSGTQNQVVVKGCQLRLEENDYSTEQNQLEKHRTPQAQNLIPKPSKSKEHVRVVSGSVSTPDFSLLPPKLNSQQQYCTRHSQDNDKPKIMDSLVLSQTTNTNSQISCLKNDDSKFQRKTAQTYLSGLSKGYIQKIDNLKLINNCLNQTQLNPLTKSFENGVQKSARGKKSNSPKRTGNDSTSGQGAARKSSKTRKSSAPNKQRNNSSDHKSKNRTQVLSGSNQKQMSQLADLNFFIKSIEKDLTEQYKNMNSIPHTPSTIIRKVEDQLKAIGYDKNSSSNLALPTGSADQKKKQQQLPPQLKILALKEALQNQIMYESTPSNISSMTASQPNILRQNSTSSPGKFNGAFGFNKLSVSNLKHPQTNRDNSGGKYDRDRSLSSGRGASSNSAGRSNTLFPQTSQLVLVTDRNQRPSTTRRDVSGDRTERSNITDHKDDKLAPTVRFQSKAKVKDNSILKNKGSFVNQSMGGVSGTSGKNRKSCSKVKSTNQKDLLIQMVSGSVSVKNSNMVQQTSKSSQKGLFPGSTKGNQTLRFEQDSASNLLYDLIQQSQQQKKKQHEFTDKAVKNTKQMKNSDKPPRREKELSPQSPNLSKNIQVATTSSEYQFATLQIQKGKTQRDFDRNVHSNSSGLPSKRPVLSPPMHVKQQKNNFV